MRAGNPASTPCACMVVRTCVSASDLLSLRRLWSSAAAAEVCGSRGSVEAAGDMEKCMSAEMPEQMQCEDIDAADGDRCEEEATHHCSKCGRMCQVTSVFPRDLFKSRWCSVLHLLLACCGDIACMWWRSHCRDAVDSPHTPLRCRYTMPCTARRRRRARRGLKTAT